MATSFTPITVISTTSGHHNHRNTSAFTASASSSGKWWTPLFGWSSDADYIHSSSSTTVTDGSGSGSGSVTETLDLDKGDECRSRSGSRFTPGGFTEEKAKQLRMKTMETNFHDVMYHSAIASRLASDVSGHNVDR